MGTLIQNGTVVNFTTTLGQFESSQQTTVDGIVTVKLLAGSTPGTASVYAFSGAAKFIRTADTSVFERVPDRLRSFDRPALVVWAVEDRVMPREHGRRLAELLPQGRLVEVADSYTMIPVDQPAELARLIREFVREAAPARAEAVR